MRARVRLPTKGSLLIGFQMVVPGGWGDKVFVHSCSLTPTLLQSA